MYDHLPKSAAEARKIGATQYIGKVCTKPGHEKYGGRRKTTNHHCVRCESTRLSRLRCEKQKAKRRARREEMSNA